ncbi:Cyclic beta-1,2-glucan synthase [Acidisarcina polymorpha]|uniref:Cyclic beta-1,2-glucan synthase n=1 Tax=Acidisarcina polymorpha TaxID=2211140 RepID=A0A2Z5FW40_9BACT|nr:Cyclic beta-1,2-glucan synthase [Acidisarcina polymorpha]
MEAARTLLDKLYGQLDRMPPPDYSKVTSPDPILELRENPRLIRAVVLEAASLRRKIPGLPRVVTQSAHASAHPGEQQGSLPRNLYIAEAYFDATQSVWNPDAFRIYLEQLQLDDPLDLEELWAIPSFMKFHLLEQVLDQAQGMLDSPSTVDLASKKLLSTRIRTLRDVGFADWVPLLESLIIFDPTLRQDPAHSYSLMDFETRESYRKRIAKVARYSEFTEAQVASAALDLAHEAWKLPITDARLYLRRSHVGYYLIDKGFPQLASRIGYRPAFIDRLRTLIRNNADDFYIGGIEVITILLMAAVIAPLASRYPVIGGLTLAFFLLLLPAAQGTVDLFNNIVTALFKAHPLPKLDFSSGIPAEFATFVAVPTLLMNEKQLRELVEELEVRFLANPDPNLHFGLVTDLPDSVTRPRENDTDPLVDLALSLINELNARYRESNYGSFFLLHRHRIFNARQGVWMGWERKRGKLLDLNKYLRGDFDAFPVKAGNLEVLRQVKYIITLDSDTQLPRGTASRLVGAIAHPLNRAIIDPRLRIVTEGYGLLQPRVGVSVSSASRSRLAAIYSGQTGFDIYARAVSDAYQDLYSEGIFTGKGIYEVASFHAVLDRRFPRNSLLSHDLIEGSYARVGLATDIEVIDDYPSHYSAYTRRKHRWVRGDWQIAQWMFSKVPDESGRFVPNPISTISRWRILDNLRRSLVEPFTFLLLVAGWLGLPGGPLYWTVATLIIFFLPNIVQLFFSLGHAAFSDQEGAVGEAFSGFLQALGVSLLTLAFLPHQTLLSLDAIVRSLVRRFITGQRLLEWETAAEAEANAKSKKRTPVDTYLAAMPLIAIALAAIIWYFNWGALHIAVPVLVLWGFSGSITAWLNAPPREQHARISPADAVFLEQQALRIWRFYAEFGSEKHNYLIPDNVEEEQLVEAPRVSTTNIGMLLNARQAAGDLGFITAHEFVDLTRRTLASIHKLEKLNGHPYNWYDTLTLAPLQPVTISSVDNGNLAASLYTLRAGALAMLKLPLLRPNLFGGLRTHWQLMLAQKGIPKQIASHPLPPETASNDTWVSWCLGTEMLEGFSAHTELSGEAAWWLRETGQRIKAISQLIRDYRPWMLPEFAPLRAIPQLGFSLETPIALATAPEFATQLEARLDRMWATSTDQANSVLSEQLRSLLPDAIIRLKALNSALVAIAEDAFHLADQMDFGFLLEKSRLLLSIGYEVATKKLHTATYDMLASEARIATFLAVAKGDIPQQSWFKLARTHTIAFNRPVLLSWTGTMFEYLMPSLWMRSYPDTLVSRTLSAAVEIQRDFARKHRIPWGISESGYAEQDPAGHYHYQAFGIPDMALKWDATAGPVVSPYSTFLALGTDAPAAMKNLRRMAKAGWVGAYGFYESADYSQTKGQAKLVREWMAHHQGMCLLAILNLLHENVVQTWFHSNPQLQATELLLHERPMREAALRAEYKQFSPKTRRTA